MIGLITRDQRRLAGIFLVLLLAFLGMTLPGLIVAWAQHGESGGHGGAASGTVTEHPAGDAGHAEAVPGEAVHGGPGDAATGHGEAAHGEAGHGGHGGEGAASIEPANLITIINHFAPPDAAWAHFLHQYENPIFSLIAVLFLSIVAIAVFQRAAHHPGRLQAAVEMVVEGLDGLVRGLLGKAGRNYTPYLGTLFLYILTMNLMGLIPLMKAPTTSINTTAALGLCTFLYVQYTGIRKLGIGGYLFHLAGSPRDTVTWILVPLMMPLHIIGELAKPLTLALRLFGNISGEDILVAAFISLGAAMLAFTHLPIGFPLQVPFLFLGMFFSTTQALVFTLLSTVYLLMMQPHEHEHEAEAH